jgi:hypothetical protein
VRLILLRHTKVWHDHDASATAGALIFLTLTALTVAAGVQWSEAYEAANKSGCVIVGGVSVGGSVGAAGGWVMGGGHSALSPSYGLGIIYCDGGSSSCLLLSIHIGVDNALQFTLVLASGEYVTANEYQHSDLFWALRGGGGGTYGVVVTVTYRTHDILPSALLVLIANFSTPAIAQNVTTDYFSILPKLSDAGLGGHSSVSPSGIMAVTFGTTNALAKDNATMSSFFERVNAVAGPQNVQRDVIPFPSFYDAYLAFFNTTSEVGVTNEVISRLVSTKVAKEQPEKIAQVALKTEGGIEFK